MVQKKYLQAGWDELEDLSRPLHPHFLRDPDCAARVSKTEVMPASTKCTPKGEEAAHRLMKPRNELKIDATKNKDFQMLSPLSNFVFGFFSAQKKVG